MAASHSRGNRSKTLNKEPVCRLLFRDQSIRKKKILARRKDKTKKGEREKKKNPAQDMGEKKKSCKLTLPVLPSLFWISVTVLFSLCLPQRLLHLVWEYSMRAALWSVHMKCMCEIKPTFNSEMAQSFSELKSKGSPIKISFFLTLRAQMWVGEFP